MALPNFNRVRSKVKVPAGSTIRYKAGQGYYTVPKGGAAAPAASLPPLSLDSRVNAILDKQFSGQTSLIDQQAKMMRDEAAARQANMQAAYQSAAKANAAMGADAQKGWNESGAALQGLAGALSGGIGEQTRQDVATTDQALANVGAPALSFDPGKQAGVESYYGGYLPGREFAQMGGAGRQAMNDAGASFNTRGVQDSMAARVNTIRDINKSVLDQYGAIASKRPDAYNSLRSLFGDEKQAALSARLANAELAQRVRQEKADLRFRYDELRQQAATEAERNALTKEEARLNRMIDQQNADTAKYNALNPASGAATKYASGTWDSKLTAVMQDELENVSGTYTGVPAPKSGRLPVLDRTTGKPHIYKSGPKKGQPILGKDGKPKTQGYYEALWLNNERLKYREHLFSSLWNMVGGNIATRNQNDAKLALRKRLWKVATNWDPNSLLADTGTAAPVFPGNPAVGDNTTVTGP